jgi:hypothetical protein
MCPTLGPQVVALFLELLETRRWGLPEELGQYGCVLEGYTLPWLLPVSPSLLPIYEVRKFAPPHFSTMIKTPETISQNETFLL